ncbi:MAG: hypothetical protein Q9170_006534 [Blastenia crenularia]
MESNMFATKKAGDAWNQNRTQAKHAVGRTASLLTDHDTCATVLPYLKNHWAFKNTHPTTPDGLYALTLLEMFHNNIYVPKYTSMKSALHCRYLNMIFVQDNIIKIPHYIFHEIVGVLGSFLAPCLTLKGIRKNYSHRDITSVVLYLEILLGDFLVQIVQGARTKNNKHNDSDAFKDVRRRRKDLVEKVRDIDYCLQERKLPSKHGDVAATAADNTAPAKLKDGVYQKRTYGDWDFCFAPEKKLSSPGGYHFTRAFMMKQSRGGIGKSFMSFEFTMKETSVQMGL